MYVSIDDNNKYVIKHPICPVYVTKNKEVQVIHDNPLYGRPFPSNLYMNELQSKVKDGIIMYLDDDDILSNNNAVSLIAEEYKKGSKLIFWKIKSVNRVIPNEKNWGKRPVNCDISGIGFAFDSKYIKHAEWEPYKRGDYRVANKLYDKIRKRAYIDKILAQTQNGHNSGKKIDLKKNTHIPINRWYITNTGGFWLGCESIGKKKVLKGEMRLADINEIPRHLIKN
jgi:hypothetical protein